MCTCWAGQDDETGAEYFPYLLAMIDAKKGSIIGISSCSAMNRLPCALHREASDRMFGRRNNG
eukprot:SAG31_NODE_2596_length_5420_cov_45.220330_5_plen_63_part_00